MRATQIAIRHDPYACELIDDYILACTERSLEHRENRFFIDGSPGAVLVTEIRGDSEEEVRDVTDRIESEMRAAGLGYAFPVLFGEDTEKIWEPEEGWTRVDVQYAGRREARASRGRHCR